MKRLYNLHLKHQLLKELILDTLRIIWLLMLDLVSFVLGYVALMNIVLCVCARPTTQTKWLTLASLVANVVVLLSVVNLPANMASGIVATVGLSWASFAYFLGQRFENATFASDFVRNRPTWLPMARLALLSTSVTTLFSVAPVWSALPLIVWFSIGFASAELAIMRERRRASISVGKRDRSFGEFAVNLNQGRKSIFSGESSKYPYP